MPPGGWSVPPRPQPWFPPYPAVSVPPPVPAPVPAPLGPVQQQPLFPVQGAMPPATLSSFQSSAQMTPPGLPANSLPVSQPLFPVGSSINMPTQNVPFTTPGISQISPADPKSSYAQSVAVSTIGKIYLHPAIQGLNFLLNFLVSSEGNVAILLLNFLACLLLMCIFGCPVVFCFVKSKGLTFSALLPGFGYVEKARVY